MEELVGRSLQSRRLAMLLLSGFAAIALALAAAGLYGVISFAAGSRTREIGIRIALGARPRAVAGMVLAQGLRVTAAGLTAGLIGFLIAAPLLRGLIYGVAPRDPVTLAVGAAVLLLCGLLASYVPANRAARLDPMAALREE